MNQQEPEVLTPEEYAAIDLVPPHQPGDGIPLSTAVERAKASTAAWLGAHEVICCHRRRTVGAMSASRGR